MWWLGSIAFLIIWVAIAFWPARVAARKGHSFLGFFLFSIVFFPAALIVAFMVHGSKRRSTVGGGLMADGDARAIRWRAPRRRP